MKSDQEKLKTTLARLDKSVQKILETRGYSRDAKSLRALDELIREQLTNANTRSATRAIR